MTTATWKERSSKPMRQPTRNAEDLEEDLMYSFYMPTSMSLDEFRQWSSSDDFPEYGRITYLGTEMFVDMNAERVISHGAVKVEICTVLNSMVRKRKTGRFFFDGVRIVNLAATVSNEPDAFFATWETLKQGTLRNIATADGEDFIELEGAPDWVMEIVSPSSVSKDKKHLRECYYRAGIPEYWLIDARGEDVEFDILRRGEEKYEAAESIKGWQVSEVFGKRFRLRRIVDPTGQPDYRLQMK